MFIKSLNREITIGVKTRKIAREVNEVLLEGVNIKGLEGESIEFPAKNADKSEELLVKLMCDLSQEEMDKLQEDEYQEIKQEIAKKK